MEESNREEMKVSSIIIRGQHQARNNKRET